MAWLASATSSDLEWSTLETPPPSLLRGQNDRDQTGLYPANDWSQPVLTRLGFIWQLIYHFSEEENEVDGPTGNTRQLSLAGSRPSDTPLLLIEVLNTNTVLPTSLPLLLPLLLPGKKTQKNKLDLIISALSSSGQSRNYCHRQIWNIIQSLSATRR